MLLPTSLVGSYAQPDGLIDREKLAGRFPPRTRVRELWRVPEEYLEQAWDDATVYAIAEQERAGLEATYTLEHGYCRSVYVVDPNGMTVEFTCDDPRAAEGDEERKAKAHGELKRWLAGDHSTNNEFRHEEAA